MSTTTRQQFVAADWPFWHPAVNPLAPETPARVARALDAYLTAGADLRTCLKRTSEAQGAGRRWSCPALDAALAAERRASERCRRALEAAEEALLGHPGYHRSGDFLVGLVWRSGGPRLEVQPASSPFPSKGVQGGR